MTPRSPQSCSLVSSGHVTTGLPLRLRCARPRERRAVVSSRAGPWRPGPETQTQKSSRARQAAIAAAATPSPLPFLPCSPGRTHSLPGFIPKPHIWSLSLRLCYWETWPEILTSQLQFFLKIRMIRLIPQGCSDTERQFTNHLIWGLPGTE